MSCASVADTMQWQPIRSRTWLCHSISWHFTHAVPESVAISRSRWKPFSDPDPSAALVIDESSWNHSGAPPVSWFFLRPWSATSTARLGPKPRRSQTKRFWYSPAIQDSYGKQQFFIGKSSIYKQIIFHRYGKWPNGSSHNHALCLVFKYRDGHGPSLRPRAQLCTPRSKCSD